MDFHFESFAAGFINVRGFYDGEGRAFRRKRDGTRDGRAGSNRCVDDLFRALVNNAVVVSAETNTDF